MSDNKTLDAALVAADTAPEILDAVARACWHNDHDRADCPNDAIPGERDLFNAYADPGAECREQHERWKKEREPEGTLKHPLAPLVRAWQARRAIEVEPDRRHDTRILPRIEIQESRSARKRGMLFGGGPFAESRDMGNLSLPLFDQAARVKRVPLLHVIDAAGVPVMARGTGAPLPARLFVRTLASVRQEDRHREVVRIALTIEELMDGLWPRNELTGWRGWRPGRHWPELRAVLMNVREYAIHDGRGRWWPLALRYLPDSPDRLDAFVVLDVAFPPGSETGPVVDLPMMDRLSVTSAPRWRAYIAAHSLLWIPGRTRVPVKRWGRPIPGAPAYAWVQNPDAYPVLTAEDRRRLAFGDRDSKHRTRLEIETAWEDLPGLALVNRRAVDPRTGEVGWLYMPESADKAPD